MVYDPEESNVLNKSGIVANSILIIFSLLNNIEISGVILTLLAISFFCNIFYAFSSDIPLKWHFFIKIACLIGVSISLILLPSFFYFCHNLDPIWSIHLCISIFFAMILLDFMILLFLLPLCIVLGYILSGTIDILSDTKIISMIYKISILGVIWYFFYQSRIRQINRSKEDIKNIVLNVSHELTTPLSSSLLKIAKLKTVDNNTASHGLIDQIQNNIKHVIMMLELFGKNFNNYIPTVVKSKVDLNSIIQEALADYPLSKSEENIIRFCPSQEPIYAYIDNELFKYIIFNLLKNALFFIKKAGKGEIFISIILDKTKIFIHFKDTGYGIRTEYKKKIFDQFFSRRKYGTGMGLYFCKLVIESFNGSIDCYSEFGQYTEFIIKLSKKEISYNNEA